MQRVGARARAEAWEAGLQQPLVDLLEHHGHAPKSTHEREGGRGSRGRATAWGRMESGGPQQNGPAPCNMIR